MSTIKVTDPAHIICELKAAVAALECYHQVDTSKKQDFTRHTTPPCAPMFMMIPIEEKNIKASRNKSRSKCTVNKSLHNIQDSEKRILVTAGKFNEKKNSNNNLCGTDLKFPEMRSSILFTRCYCVHRDGLQDSCPLNQCQGQLECLIEPWPTCPPAKCLQSRHPKQYPA